jgi:hypothetical protein
MNESGKEADEEIHKGLKNLTASYCILEPKDSNSNKRKGYCIEYMNMGKSYEGNFQLIVLLLGLKDEKKIEKVYMSLRGVYYKALGVTSSMDYETYKEKIYKSPDRKSEEKELNAITSIPLVSRLQLIGCILNIKNVEILKNLVRQLGITVNADEKTKIAGMTGLWYSKSQDDLKKMEGGAFRRIISGDSSKNIYSIYMKHSRKNHRKTKHRGGTLPSQSDKQEVKAATDPQPGPVTQPGPGSQSDVKTETVPQPDPGTQPDPAQSKPWWRFWGGSRRRRKLKRRKTSKRH